MRFRDRFGNEWELWAAVWEHIHRNHPEIELSHIEQALSSPDSVVRSNWDDHGLLYYKRVGPYFKVVVVDDELSRIKTVLTTNKIKQGEQVWPTET